MFRKALSFLSLALMAVLFAAVGHAQGVSGVPDGTARDKLERVVRNFNEIWRDQAVITSIEVVGKVDDLNQAVAMMMDTAVLPEIKPGTNHLMLVPMSAGKLKDMNAEEAALLRESLRLNVSQGDYVVQVNIKAFASGQAYKSLNAVRPDGRVFSGVFFGAFRGGPGEVTRSKRANTVCEGRVLTTYLWGSSAEVVEVCVRASCDRGECRDCFVTAVNSFAGFFAKLKVHPGNVPLAGKITADQCCLGSVAWAWATGFKSIKLGGKDMTLEIVGNLGQSANGIISAQECCRANEKPIVAGSQVPEQRPNRAQVGSTQ